MSVGRLSWLDLLDRHCRKGGLALLLTAHHQEPLPFAGRGQRTVLRNLDVVRPAAAARGGRRGRLKAGDLVVRANVDALDGDPEAAAELLVGLLLERQGAGGVSGG